VLVEGPHPGERSPDRLRLPALELHDVHQVEAEMEERSRRDELIDDEPLRSAVVALVWRDLVADRATRPGEAWPWSLTSWTVWLHPRNVDGFVALATWVCRGGARSTRRERNPAWRGGKGGGE